MRYNHSDTVLHALKSTKHTPLWDLIPRDVHTSHTCARHSSLNTSSTSSSGAQQNSPGHTTYTAKAPIRSDSSSLFGSPQHGFVPDASHTLGACSSHETTLSPSAIDQDAMHSLRRSSRFTFKAPHSDTQQTPPPQSLRTMHTSSSLESASTENGGFRPFYLLLSSIFSPREDASSPALAAMQYQDDTFMQHGQRALM